MNRLSTLIAGRDPVLVDGAMGTMLQDAGLEPGGAGELWNVEQPQRIAAIHEAYAEAGASILTTNTFGGTRPRLAMYGLEDRVAELSEAGAARGRRGRASGTARWWPAASARPASCWSRSAPCPPTRRRRSSRSSCAASSPAASTWC